MGETTRAEAKASEAKKENMVSQKQNAGISQSISSPAEQILFLQRTIGNEAIGRLIKSGAMRAKLRIGKPGDKYEQEANRVARQVLSVPDAMVANSMQRAISPEKDKDQMLKTNPLADSITPVMQLQMGKDEEKENEPIQVRSAGLQINSFEAGDNVETQVSLGKGRGSPLPDPVRAYMEPRFGVDFSQVRVHTGSNAIQMNQAVGAQAFTHGSDIYLGAGKSPDNLELIAHELTHVVQQTGGAPLQMRKQEKYTAQGPKLSVKWSWAAEDQYGQEADRFSRQVMHTPGVVAANSIQRAISPEIDKDQTLRTMLLQRNSLNPLDWAYNLLNSVRGDASAQGTQVSNDASARAGELESQGTARSSELQSQSATRGMTLQGEASAQGIQVNKQSVAQGAALQSQASSQGAQLSGESSTHAAALQQEASTTSSRLQGDVGALESEVRSTEMAAESKLGADVAGIQGEADASTGLVQGQWGVLETQTTERLTSLKTRTQALVDQKTALVKEYEAPGKHDPEQFQQRWKALQGQVGSVEQEQSTLESVEGSCEAISERASTIWANLGNRGQGLLNSVTSVASSAWNALQGRWSALQGTAAAAMAGLQGRASAAVNGLKSLATNAWTGLQGAANQAWMGLKGIATGAWTGLQSRATAAWTSMQGQATAAWTGLQSIAGSVVGALAGRISGIISRISGAVGSIISLISSAVGSLLSWLRSTTSTALNFLRTRASGAWNAVKGLGTRAWEGLKNLGTRAWEGLESLGTRAWEGLKDLGTRAWEGLKDLGTRAWTGLKDLGQRAWNGLKSVWEKLKKGAQAAWTWMKDAWEKLKRKASQLLDWIKRKAREALAWLKKKWAWLKAMVRKARDWLKAKWHWLKSLVKIKIRVPDQTLCKLHNFKPWKFVDLHSGRIPIAKKVVDPGFGPVELALFVKGDAVATVGGYVGPCMLKNIMFTLQPLISRYTGQADFHVPGTAFETLVLTGTIGGTANYGGNIGLVGGGLQGTGTATALGAFTAKPRFLYDSGKIAASVPVRLDFCLEPTIDLDAFLVAQFLLGSPPSTPPPSTPIAPGPIPLLPGSGSPVPGISPPVYTSGGGSMKAPPEEVIKEWKARWHLAGWSKRDCWDVKGRFSLVSGPGGLPEPDLQFTAKPTSMGEVIRHMFNLPPISSSRGVGGSVHPLGQTYACAICKCSGDKECGGGRIHTIWMGKTECNRENKKKAQELCNHDGTFLSICDLDQNRKDGKKCSVHHHDFACSDRESEDKCTNRQQSTGLMLKTDLQALIDAGNTTYADYKTKIVAATPGERADVLLDTALLRNMQRVLAWNDFAKCVELLGRSAPTAGSMLADPTVSAAMSAAFTASSPAVTLPPHNPANPVGPCNPPAGTPPPVGVHEEGGWIYQNLITGNLATRRAAGGGQANINLGGPPNVADSIVVGTFHTHPNVGPCWGAVFPSGTDTNSANGTGVPWLIIGAFPNVATTQTTSTGPGQRLHLAGNRGFPGATGGEAPQATVDRSFDEV